jgi:hypothetical protein
MLQRNSALFFFPKKMLKKIYIHPGDATRNSALFGRNSILPNSSRTVRERERARARERERERERESAKLIYRERVLL